MIADELGCFRAEIGKLFGHFFRGREPTPERVIKSGHDSHRNQPLRIKYPRTNTLTVVDGIKAESPGV